MQNLIERARAEGIELIQVCALIHIGDELLLLERSISEEHPYVYEFVRGEVRPNETLTQALQRSVIMETGANIENIESYLGHRDEMNGERRTRHLHFIVTLVDPYDIRSTHHDAFAWKNYKEAIGYPITDGDRETIDLFGKWRESAT